MKLKIKDNIFAILLALIAIFVSLVNWVPGSYLSGWDTIHPEFNFSGYLQRVLNVWQEIQGLGAVPSQAHAAELPRLLIIYFFSLFLPNDLIRYSYFFLTLLAGPLGVFYYLRTFLKSTHLLSYTQNAVSYLGGLLYLLNLAVLQHFQVPLEMFATHFAAMGWIFLFATSFLIKREKKDLILFTVSIIFSAPMAHTPTLFYVFLVMFVIYLLSISLFYNHLQKTPLSQNGDECLSDYSLPRTSWWRLKVGFSTVSCKLLKKTADSQSAEVYKSVVVLKRSALLILLVILTNLYWILPNLYYIKNYGNAVVASKIHSQFSDRAFLVGINFANIRDTALLKNFIFEWGKYDDSRGIFTHLLETWQPHLRNTRINLIGLLIFLLIFLGIIFSLKKRHLLGVGLFPIFIISFFFIANDNFLFQILITLFEKNTPILKEALRFPYTKFSILLLFTYTFYFSFMLAVIIAYLKRKLHFFPKAERLLTDITTFAFTLLLIVFVFPVFKGGLINSKMKVEIPQAYFDLFKWFKEQPKEARIAQFPAHSFWGWSYYNFGYEGAGFLWFGLNQPLLNREFDRWMPFNENFYWEVSLAIYSRDLNLLEKVLDKYQVKYLLTDAHAVDASSAKSPYLKEFEELITNSKRITLLKVFDRIKVYNFENSFLGQKFVSVFDNLPAVSPKYIWSNLDKGYFDLGDYVALDEKDKDANLQIYYPFRSLFSNRSQQEHEFNVLETDKYFTFKKSIPKQVQNFHLNIPNINQQSLIWVDKDKLDQIGYYIPTIAYEKGVLTVSVPKLSGYFTASIDPAKEIDKLKVKNCDFLSAYKKGRKREDFNLDISHFEGMDFLRINSVMGNNCSAEFLLKNLPNKFSYLISVESRNIKNKSLLFWLENINAKRSDLENYLPKGSQISKSYFIQPPMEEYGQGYFLHFDNWSFNHHPSVNDLGRINIYPIPYKYLINISFINPQIQPKAVKSKEFIKSVNKFLAFLYVVKLKPIKSLDRPSILLSQSFDNGWVAYTVDGLKIKRLKKHILINNWANGWELSEEKGTKRIVIIFLPQFLQFFGYLTLIFSLIFVVKYIPRRVRSRW